MNTIEQSLRILSVNALAVLVVACGKKEAGDDASLASALESQAPFCTYPITWPADVSADDVSKAADRPTSLGGQLVALERLGLAQSQVATKENAKLYGGTFKTEFVRFALTDAGKTVAIARWPSEAEKGKARICYAKRKVIGIVEKKDLGKLNGIPAVQVSYTYQLKDQAPFLSDPLFQQSFPEVAKVLAQAGTVTCKAVVKFPEGNEAEVARTPDGLSDCQGDY